MDNNKNSENIHGPILNSGKQWEEQMLDDMEQLHDEARAGREHIRRMNQMLNEGKKINEVQQQ